MAASAVRLFPSIKCWPTVMLCAERSRLERNVRCAQACTLTVGSQPPRKGPAGERALTVPVGDEPHDLASLECKTCRVGTDLLDLHPSSEHAAPAPSHALRRERARRTRCGASVGNPCLDCCRGAASDEEIMVL